MNIAIVDDLKKEADKLRVILSEYALDNSTAFSINYYPSAEAFLEKYNPSAYDLVFMDIYMTGMTGIEAAGIISRNPVAPLLVFLTQSSEHMYDAFHIHAYDYLLKPISSKRVYRLMDDVISKQTTVREVKELSFNLDRIEYKLPYDMILSIKSDRHYLDIYALDGKSYKTRMNFSEVGEMLLKDKRFLTVLRGIIVNMDYIVDMSDGVCILEKDVRLPVNLKNQKHLEQSWQTYMFEKVKQDNLERLRSHDD